MANDVLSATEILSKIFDKDGVRYTKLSERIFGEKIKVHSNNCNIEIKKLYKYPGYEMMTNCKIDNDLIKKVTGATGFIERFEIVRDKEQGLFVFGHSNESVQRAGEVSFTTTTKTKYPHHQSAEIICDNDKCKLIKGTKWEDYYVRKTSTL